MVNCVRQPKSPWTQLTTAIRSRVRAKARKVQCTVAALKKQVISAIPILNWFANYDIRSCLVGDVAAGFTVGILNIPQGMAYGVLSGVEAINGLYASFFPVIIYSSLCTSQHAAVGTFAVTSLMTGGIVHTVSAEMYSRQNYTDVDNATLSVMDDIGDRIPFEFRLRALIAITLCVGLWQLMMGIFRFGYFAVLLSDHLIKGFTTAAAFHVFSTQLKLVFGLHKIKEWHGPLKLIYFYYEFFSHLGSTHIPTLVFSLVCITVLYLTRVFVNQNPRVMKVIRFPVPIELLVIIFATLTSYEMELETSWGVETIYNIPTGLPSPVLPPFSMIPELLGRTFSLAIVASAILISLAKIFAAKRQYKIDCNQELIAAGLANIFGAFFLCIPVTGALARSALQESVGGSTQMVSLVSATIVLIVLVALGRFLEPLPRACLGCIIMVALINMLKGAMEIVRLWKVSLIDASIFMVTLLATLLLDVDFGLAIGVLYSLLVFAFRLQYGQLEVMGRLRGTKDEIMPIDEPKVDEIIGVKIFRLHGPLYSGNAESFVSKVRKAVLANEKAVSVSHALVPEPAAKKWIAMPGEFEEFAGQLVRRRYSQVPANLTRMRMQAGRSQSEATAEISHDSNAEAALVKRNLRRHSVAPISMTTFKTIKESTGSLKPIKETQLWVKEPIIETMEEALEEPLRAIIIDCSSVSFIDVVGSDALLRLARECSLEKGIRLILAACSGSVRDIMVLSGFTKVVPAECFVKNVFTALESLDFHKDY
ncbi:Solute carrier family 26 member 6 [Hypsibius exemplaris]|uniref:Solute carrier family 26 member 6 n=1 Tax=Hypsibius exemplaris TaxID=2072580 RepID=A0A1W0WHD1_HYPEX|nr:Solute carrier family 26 member 6 [Hypsibius exemplaris]